MLSRSLIMTGALLATFSGGVLAQDTAPDYSELDSWLCHPDNDQDACDRNLDTTYIAADGSFSRVPFEEGKEQDIDCFYVYPTTSMDESGNSDLIPGEQGEIITAYLQTARLRKHCKVYAPIYRQVTIPALRARMTGQPIEIDPTMNYRDVLDAWNHYMEHENNGRGFVLVGHSQGSGLLNRLIATEIDGKPVQQQLVSAIIGGSTVTVEPGKKTGGTFKNIPVCETADQNGCVIAFATYRDRIPPPDNGMFGRGSESKQAVCTNPASLSGGKAELDARLSSIGEIAPSFGSYKPWVSDGKTVETPFVSLPGMLYGECVQKGNFHYLEVSVKGDPSDPRLDDIIGDLYSGGEGELNPSWGLHLIDMSLVMGNLVDIVGQQAEAYTSR
ncbi:DUF3089 domain-containing protein [Gilvimarinus sp. F26214L]|uniref:DUF3089 domain-containing protein n=1 Tax=Gilvimarinus sp. DZF01 TaxID=3461371 RepID=UPI004046379C